MLLHTLIILALYGCNTTKIIDPSPTDAPSSLTSEDVYSAIMLSLQDVPDVPDVTSSGQIVGNHPYEWMAGEISPENPSWHHEEQDGNVIHAGFYRQRNEVYWLHRKHEGQVMEVIAIFQRPKVKSQLLYCPVPSQVFPLRSPNSIVILIRRQS